MSAAELVVVVRALSVADRELEGRERVARSSARAREALARAAELSGAVLAELEKDDNDAPLPSAGWHWSIAHAGDRAAGVVARQAVGVDLEPVRARRPELVAAALDARERALLEAGGRPPEEAFVRGWTAKEAVLKKLGVGLSELSHCRLLSAQGLDVLELEHKGRPHRAHLSREGGTTAAVSFDGPDRPVRWVREVPAEERS